MEVFIQISIVIAVVFLVSLVMRMLKQPLIIGYILSGIIVGPFLLNLISDVDIINVFSEFGIAFLLFIVGLHLSPKVIKDVGKISLITGIGQVIFTALIGYFIAVAFGFPTLTAIYIAIALTFSSTIIIMKLLSDRGDLGSLYGKISIGFLLVQDLIAILILMVISSFSSGTSVLESIGTTLLRGIGLIAILIPIGMFVLPKLGKVFARSQEFLFVFSIAWGLGLASLFFYAGLSIEVGALIAGILLSISPYSIEISSKMKPLRDFFIISFFILLGAQMTLGGFGSYLIPALVFSLFILIGNPLIVVILMGIFGYTKRTGFQAGLTVAQISEFSLILIMLGVKMGHVTQEILSFVTFIGLITIAGSTYMIMYAEKIYPRLSKYLKVFERKKIKKERVSVKKPEAILFGYNRIGYSILTSLKKINKKYLVVDYNPDVVSALNKFNVPVMYGDAFDPDFIEELDMKQVNLVVSTIPDTEANLALIDMIRNKNKKTIIIVRAHQIDDALELYKKGADYVLTPHFLGGEYVAKMIGELKTEKKQYSKEKQKHMKMLEGRKTLRHNHPDVERS